MKLLRLLVGSLWVAAALLLAALDIFLVALRHGFRPPLTARAVWLQRNSRRMVKIFVADRTAAGDLPRAGLLVSNHVSYVDILVLGTLAPAVFVAKSEVAGWPVFGWFAQVCGTIFVRRAVRGDVSRIGGEIRDRLERGFLVVLFPEGTSSDGREVLPFKSSLLEPVRAAGRDVFAAHVSYRRADGSPVTDVPYWGGMTLLPHMLKLLSQPRVKARVSLRDLLALTRYIYNNRKFILDLTANQDLPTAYVSGQFGELSNFNKVPGLDNFLGGKVGETTAAGQTSISLHSLRVKGEDRVIAIILLDSKSRGADVRELLQYAQDRFGT